MSYRCSSGGSFPREAYVKVQAWELWPVRSFCCRCCCFKWVLGCSSVVQHLPSMRKTLTLNHSTARRKKWKKWGRETSFIFSKLAGTPAQYLNMFPISHKRSSWVSQCVILVPCQWDSETRKSQQIVMAPWKALAPVTTPTTLHVATFILP